MRRSCSALFLITLSFVYCELASAQSAPPSSPTPAAPGNAPPAAAPAAQRASGAPAPAAPTSPAPSAPAPSPSSSPAPTAAPTTVPSTSTAPAATPEAPAQGQENAGAGAPTSENPPTPSTQAVPAAPAEPEAAAPAPEQRPSFLDAHPPGYLPPLFRSDSRVHRGFSVRVSAGLGYGIMRRRVTETASYKVRGLEGQLSLDIGASVIDNLIVFGRFSGFAWNSLFESDSRNAGGAYLGLLGAGARYYLMPSNAFASAAVGVAALQVLDDLGKAQNANPGIGLELEVGKDFWAGTPLDQRGIGLSLRFGWVHCGSVARGDEELKPWNSYSISALFSAAYN